MRKILFLIFLVFGLIFIPSTNIGQEVIIDEIEVSSSRVPMTYSESSRVVEIIDQEEIQRSPATSLEDLLESKLSIDVRERGSHSVQTDVSLRGGSFDQVMIMVNGVSLNDPQTGHHSMNIPVPLENIDRIEILEGPGSRIYGPNAFSGVINIITSTETSENTFDLSLSAGQHNLLTGAANSNFSTGKVKNFVSVSKQQSDGYIDNTDFDINTVYYQGILPSKVGRFKFQSGWMDKQFGANSFYTASYPDQFEQIRSYFGNLSYETGNKNRFKAKVYARNHHDRFELFREDEDYYIKQNGYWINDADTAGYGGGYFYGGHNYHMTHVHGADVSLTTQSKFGKTAFGANYRNEKIWSNVLGNPMNDTIDAPFENDGVFTKSQERKNISIFAEHSVTLKKWSFAGGVLANFHEDFDWNFSPGIDLSYQISLRTRLFASVNQSVRMPTFTDLYYVGPTNIGNPDIKPEKALTSEIGVKYVTPKIRTHVSVFHRDGTNMIDWVKLTAEDKWESQNITEVKSFGVEMNTSFNIEKIVGKKIFINSIDLNYSYIELSKSSGDYISRYALDNLKHKLGILIDHKLWKNASLCWNIMGQDRNGSYSDAETGKEEDYDPFLLVDAKLRYKMGYFTTFIEASNIFAVDYFDHGNLEMPGRWIRVGANLNLNFD